MVMVAGLSTTAFAGEKLMLYTSMKESLIGKLRVQAITVRIGMHGHGPNAQLTAGGDDPDRDLATIGNQDFRKHLRPVAP